MQYNSVILRYGEIALKSNRNRYFFEKLYLQAIKNSLKNYKLEILSFGKRFIIHHKNANEFLTKLKKIPGIQSFSLAHHFTFINKDDLIKYLIEQTKNLVKDKTFKINTKRTGKHDFSSMDLSMYLGKEIEPYSNGVDLTNPQFIINLEIRENNCYLYFEQIEGVGGLPPTSAGKVLCLFSGGIDSPVAAYQMLKRGCSVDFLYINMLGDAQFSAISKVYNELILNYAHGYTPKFHVVNAYEIVKKLKEEVPSTLRQIALKIIFYKIASRVAQRNKQLAIVTGEALSQKSSQTLLSLSVIASTISKLVLRPLIGMDKTEIVKIARELNTFDYSEKVKEFCNISEGPVTTNPTMQILDKIPSFEDETNEALKDVLTFKGEIEIVEEENINFENKDSLKDLILVDIRDESKIKQNNINSQIQIPYPQILDNFDKFSKENNYLIICYFGLKSFDVAKKLNKMGVKASSTSIKKFLNENIYCER